ncbi:RT0821/Lpp0805 family surface protein [Rivibacter subsaxonicus]|uniref:Outer membrane surface antigen n=1 Tax=Rivibacter subsaxonicus TaxID=457575 RepID=A0A4Q7VGK7_9BURK|nr:RT0821/Lpp0805 family surface protein [Rivibacter subsaxonicus]RZT95176.1 outer membrane surface antigen [Rivibacter subsaxonicus]
MFKPRHAISLLLLLPPLLAVAGNYSFMADTPISRFNDADRALYKAAIDKALTTDALGQPVEWKNDKTGSSGSVTPKAADGECRLLAVSTRHAALHNEGEHKLCRVNGKWKVAK